MGSAEDVWSPAVTMPSFQGSKPPDLDVNLSLRTQLPSILHYPLLASTVAVTSDSTEVASRKSSRNADFALSWRAVSNPS